MYVLADILTYYWIAQLNDSAESLSGAYAPGKHRAQTYREMVETVLASVRAGQEVCFAAYGHPGVFAFPTHEVIRRARAEGYSAVMLPGISAEDCLFADLGVDPGTSGCQSFEATDLLIYRRVFDPHVALVLWQIGVIAERSVRDDPQVWNREGLAVLAEELLRVYPADHEVTVYEAATYALSEPRIERVALSQLAQADVGAIATLYVPPLGPANVDAAMLRRLGMQTN